MQIDLLRRRDIITLLGGAAAWPLAARAQQRERMRRVGVLMNWAADDLEGQAGVMAFKKALEQLGWSDGRNLSIETRWGADDVERDRQYAEELMAFSPDIFLASGTLSATALQRVTHTLPIVFVNITDPTGSGLVDSLARPGGKCHRLYEF